MFLRLLAAGAPLLLSVSAAAQIQDRPLAVTPADLRRHIEVLASDSYEGRQPGTEGENKTLLYISTQLQRLGLEPAGEDGGWYQPVGLVRRARHAHRSRWSQDGRASNFSDSNLLLIGRDPVEQVKDAPVVFVGHGTSSQLAGADLVGAVALMLYSAPRGIASYEERISALRKGGAAAVIRIVPDDLPWSGFERDHDAGSDRLQSHEVPRIEGVMAMAAAADLLSRSGRDFDRLVADAFSPHFRAVPLNLRSSLDVSTKVRNYTSYNVIGRRRGLGKTGESVLYLAHWDHIGLCAPEARDKICNGAVDNASGIALLIEIAARLAADKRPERDLLFMATTAEEMGLYGAEHFAANPTVPLNSIVAAMNVDTVAIHHAGAPVSIVGRGVAPLDALVAETAAELARTMDNDTEADEFIERQDGWMLARAGVPAVMVGGSFSDMTQLGAFLSTVYHKPGDDLDRPLVLDGAAEDAELLIALGRKLSDPKRYQPPKR